VPDVGNRTEALSVTTSSKRRRDDKVVYIPAYTG
jgi:hypothetical protein